MKKNYLFPLTLFIVILLSACGSQTAQTPPEPATPTETALQPTQPPTATETTTAIPTETATELPTEIAAITSSETPVLTSNGVSYKNDVMPIFQNSCVKCHGIESIKKGLDLTTYENLMAGSFNGSVIEPGNANDSYLVQQVVEGEMPKRGNKLSDADIQAIIDWVNAGALNN